MTRPTSPGPTEAQVAATPSSTPRPSTEATGAPPSAREPVVPDPAPSTLTPQLGHVPVRVEAVPSQYHLHAGESLRIDVSACNVFAVHDGPRPADGGVTTEPVYDPWPDPPWTATLTPRQDRVAVGDPLVMDVEICNTHAASALNLIVHPELGLPAHVDIRLQHLGIVAQGARIAPPEGGRGSPPPVTETVGIAPGACRTWTAVWNGIEGLVVNGQTEGPAAEPGPWEVRMTVYPPLPVEVFTRSLGGDRVTIELVAG